MERWVIAKYDIGDVVRVSPLAFPGSNERQDVAARGQVGTIIEILDDELYRWRGSDGTVTCPITSELEYAQEGAG